MEMQRRKTGPKKASDTGTSKRTTSRSKVRVAPKKLDAKPKASKRHSANATRSQKPLVPWKNIEIRSRDLKEEDYELLKNHISLFVDTETGGLEYRKHNLQQVQISTSDKQVWIVRLPNLKSKWLIALFLMSSIEFIFHHAGFDVRFLRWHLHLPKFFFGCTKILSKIVQLKESSSLGPVTKRVLQIDRDKGHALSDWAAKNLTEEQVRYAAEDVIYLPEIHGAFSRAMTSDQNEIYWEAIDAVEKIIELELKGRADLLQYADAPDETTKLMNDYQLQKAKRT